MVSRVVPDQKMLIVGYRIQNEIPTPKTRGFLLEYFGKEIEEDEAANGREVDEWNVLFTGGDDVVFDSDADTDAPLPKPGVIPGLGLWIWEGLITIEHDAEPEEDPGDVEYTGTWRRLTAVELERLHNGQMLWR